MSNRFVIQWKSKANGRVGRGSKTFTRNEAEQLAAELNQDYPEIEHQAVDAPPEGAEAETTQQPTVSETAQTVVTE